MGKKEFNGLPNTSKQKGWLNRAIKPTKGNKVAPDAPEPPETAAASNMGDGPAVSPPILPPRPPKSQKSLELEAITAAAEEDIYSTCKGIDADQNNTDPPPLPSIKGSRSSRKSSIAGTAAAAAATESNQHRRTLRLRAETVVKHESSAAVQGMLPTSEAPSESSTASDIGTNFSGRTLSTTSKRTRDWGNKARESVKSLGANMGKSIGNRILGDKIERPGNLLGVTGIPVEVAVAYRFTQDAMEGRQKNGKGGLFFRSWFVQLSFLININKYWVKFIYILSICHCLLAMWEPAARGGSTPAWVSVMELVFICMFMLDVALKMVYVGFKKYLSKTQHRLQTGVTFCYLIDWCLYVIGGIEPRFSRFLRPGILMVRNRDLRRTVNSLIKMLPDLLALFLGLGCYIIFFGLLGIHLFHGNYNDYNAPPGADEYTIPGSFDNIGSACLRLYVLFSTENYPEIALPAFHYSKWSILYFLTFMYFGTFVLHSVLLATIVSIYLEAANKTVTKERKKEWKTLATAFTLLDGCHGGQGAKRGYIEIEVWNQLMQAMRPDGTYEEYLFLFKLLDRESKNKIDTIDFLDLREITQLKLKKHDEKHRHPGLDNSWVAALNNSKRASQASQGIIVLNTIISCVHWKNIDRDVEQTLVTVNIVLYAFMLAGVFVQVTAEGWEVYREKGYKILDFCIVIGSLPLYVIAVVNFDLIGLAVFANMLMFMRLCWRMEAGKSLLSTLGRIIPPMFFMTLFVLCAMYVFAIIGIELFHGIQSEDPNDGYFYQYDCNFGFDSFGCAMFALFQSMTTSNWHEIMNSLMNSFSQASALYFVLFFLIVNLVLLNLMVAVTIEAFVTARTDMKSNRKKLGQRGGGSVGPTVVTLPTGKKRTPTEPTGGTSQASSPLTATPTDATSLATSLATRSALKNGRASDSAASPGTDASKSKKRGSRGTSRFHFRHGSNASAGAEAHPTEVGHRRLLRKIWRTAARNAAGQPMTTPVSGTPEQSTSNLSVLGDRCLNPKSAAEAVVTRFKVIRRHGSWRRELVQKKSDALGLIETDDIKALSKASGDDMSKLLAAKREKRRQLKNSKEKLANSEAIKQPEQDKTSSSQSAASNQPDGKFDRMSFSQSGLHSLSPILRRYSQDSLLLATTDEEGRSSFSMAKPNDEMRPSTSSLNVQTISEEEPISRQNSSRSNTTGEAGNSRITHARSGWKSESTKSNGEGKAEARKLSTDSTASSILTEQLSSRPVHAATAPSKMNDSGAKTEAEEATAVVSAFPDAAGTASTDGAHAGASNIPAAVPASAGKSDVDMEASLTTASSTPVAILATSLSTVSGSLGSTDSTAAPTPSTGAAITPAQRLSGGSILARDAGSSGEPVVKKVSLWKLKRDSMKKLARNNLAQAEAAVQAAENAAISDSDASSDEQGEQYPHAFISRSTSPGHFSSRRQSEASLLEIDPHNDEDAQEAAKGIASLKTLEEVKHRESETSTPTAEVLKQARTQ